jgi:hypothetical protein
VHRVEVPSAFAENVADTVDVDGTVCASPRDHRAERIAEDLETRNLTNAKRGRE